MKTNHVILLLVVSVSIIVFVYAFLGGEAKQDEYTEKINAKRTQKNRKFRTGREVSPLSEAEKKKFVSLNYFDPNQAYKIRATIEKLDDDSVYTFRTSKKSNRKMKKYGIITFKIGKKEFKLSALRGLDPLTNKILFVPFTDETSGTETYGAGRYLDLSIPETNQITLDFNMAYNPYCAYNESYECPFPPAENHLKTRIEAGEKIFKTE